MRIPIFTLIFVLALAVDEVTPVVELREYVINYIKQIIQSFSSQDHPKEGKKELHNKSFHNTKLLSTGGHYPEITTEKLYSTTPATDEQTSPWEVEDFENSESPLEATFDIPDKFLILPVGANRKESTTPLPPPSAADTTSPEREETHLNPIVETSTVDVQPVIDPRAVQGAENHTPSQKGLASDTNLPSVVISSPMKGKSEKKDFTKVDNNDESQRVIFKGNAVKTTPVPLEAGYTIIYDGD